MVATLVILFIFAAAFATTLWRSVAATFTYVLLPATLLVFTVAPLEIHKLPDVTALSAVGYGVALAYVLKGGEPLGFRLHPIDWIVVLLSVIMIVSNAMAENLWTGVNGVGREFFSWLIPYFMGRATFSRRHYRLRAAQVLTVLAVFLALIALYEMRFDPYFYSRRILKPFGLTTTAWVMVLTRFDLFRAQASFAHPIDLGNGGALIACLIVVLACTSGRRLTTRWVAVGVGASLLMTLASLSFTSFVAVGAIIAIFVAARATRLAGALLLPASFLVVVFYIGFTAYLINKPLETPNDFETLNSSYYIRHLIVQQSWPYVKSAGLWGWGPTFQVTTTGLLSVDNAYLFFVLRQGWPYLVIFLVLMTVVNIYGGMAILLVRDRAARTPVAAGVAGLVGTTMGMYTVFFGFVYARLFIILLGLTVTMCQIALARAAAASEPLEAAESPGPVPRRNGMAPLRPGGRRGAARPAARVAAHVR